MPEQIAPLLGKLAKLQHDRIKVFDFDDQLIAMLDASDVSPEQAERLKSNRWKSRVTKTIKSEFGRVIEIIVTTEGVETHIQEAISALLATKFPNSFVTVFATVVPSMAVNIWLLPAVDHIDRKTKKNIGELCQQIVAPFGYSLAELDFGGKDREEPSLPALLRLIKVNQPVTLAELTKASIVAGFDVPSNRWLWAQLEKLRKRKLIAYASNARAQAVAEFAVSEDGLGAIPSQLGRNSSDIARALVLANRKW